MPIFTRVAREIDIFFSFSWRDWSTTIIPGSIFAAGAMRNPPLTTLIARYLLLVTWLVPYVYFFNLSNQITGIDEDRINKPDRPIPSGKVTVQGAQRRWIVTLSTFLGIGLCQPMLLPETLCCISITAFLCVTPFGNHWLGKNCVALTMGTWTLLRGSWKAIAHATPTNKTWVRAVSVWAGLMMQIQGLRDMQGDAAVGRKTLPLIFGDMGSRLLISFFAIPAAYWVLYLGGIFQLAPFTLGALHLTIGYRVLRQEGQRYDHNTYMFFTYIFCFVLALCSLDSHGLI